MVWRSRNDDPEDERRDADRDEGERSTIGSRIESIIAAAEQAAAGIRQDAEENARRYYEDSRQRADEVAVARMREVADLTDGLIKRAKTVAQQSDELIAALEEAGRQAMSAARSGARREPAPAPEAGGAEADPLAPPPASEAPPPRHEPREAPATLSPPVRAEGQPSQPTAPEPSAAPAQVSQGARLLATQMAVAGSSRDQIARRLHDEFGIRDASAILNEIGL